MNVDALVVLAVVAVSALISISVGGFAIIAARRG
uniref:Uncharacterized protein n=1 Tax=Leviviridae sp. TaxID=2027243 RepID=A0A514D568_9VIRU|nr:MAG: hypothetical protein H2RhizoLitter491640_000003 [Leviviridae sp.]